MKCFPTVFAFASWRTIFFDTPFLLLLYSGNVHILSLLPFFHLPIKFYHLFFCLSTALAHDPIIDSQSVKNTDTAKEKGYDAGKKIPGIKHHIAVDSQGLPHAISVTTADVTDRNGAIELLKINKNNLTDVKNVMADYSYYFSLTHFVKTFVNTASKILL